MKYLRLSGLSGCLGSCKANYFEGHKHKWYPRNFKLGVFSLREFVVNSPFLAFVSRGQGSDHILSVDSTIPPISVNQSAEYMAQKIC